MKRRKAISLIGSGAVGISGCLRLSDEGDSTTEESSDESLDDESQEVTLTENWTDENGASNIWTRQNTFYYNDYNYAAEASHGNGVRWSADTTYNGFDKNHGTDAFAADDQYAVFGYTPEVEESEEMGAHFHAYRRYDGEKLWTVGAPSDGTHKLAAGATVVNDIAALAISDYGDGNTGEPLVYGTDIETGEIRWQVDQSTLSRLLIRDIGSYDGNVYVATTEGIQVLAGDTGTSVESQEHWYVGSYRFESLSQIHGETLFAAGWQNTLDAHPIDENGLSWSTSELGTVSTTPAVDNSLVVVGTTDGDVNASGRPASLMQ